MITPEELAWLQDHRLWDQHGGSFGRCTSIIPIFVDPVSGDVSDCRADNTRLDVWIEAGPMVVVGGKLIASHDIDLDCGGTPLGEALANLASLVRHFYGDGTTKRVPHPDREADLHTLAIAIDRDPSTPMLAEMAAKHGENDPDILRCRRVVEFMEAE